MRQEINPKIMRASITLLTDGVSLHNNKAKMIWSPFLLLNSFQWNSCMGVLNCSWATEDICSSPLVCGLQIYLHISILAKINRITMFSTNIIPCSTWISFIKIKLSTKLKKNDGFFCSFPPVSLFYCIVMQIWNYICNTLQLRSQIKTGNLNSPSESLPCFSMPLALF